MNTAGKIASGIAATLTVAAIVAATERATFVKTYTLNPQNLYTYASFQCFAKDFDDKNQESFKIVNDFVRSQGGLKLVAKSNRLLLRDGFVYTYRHEPFDDEYDANKLTDWDAVRKYLQIEKEVEKARKNGHTYYISNS